MEYKNWHDLVKQVRIEYKKLGFIACPAFMNENVYFNHYGISHLLYKDRVPRSMDEITKRLELLRYAKNIIKNTKTIHSEEKSKKENSEAYFWTIKQKLGNRIIRIILRRIDNGTIHFFSIMND